jgi:hypothetical protein
MPTYRIVVEHESPEHTSIVWLDLDDDEAARAKAVAMLAPGQGGWVWDGERPVGYAIGSLQSLTAPNAIGSKREAMMHFLSGLFRRHAPR